MKFYEQEFERPERGYCPECSSPLPNLLRRKQLLIPAPDGTMVCRHHHHRAWSDEMGFRE